MYNIGDTPWYAGQDYVERKVVCPDCLDQKYLTVILGDGSQVTIPCTTCSIGYDPPRGFIIYHEASTAVRQVKICHIELSDDEVKYGHSGSSAYCYRTAAPDELFDTREEAMVKAEEIAERLNKEEDEKIRRKKDSNRSWAWHVTYYRNQIRDYKKTIAFAQQQLNAAEERAKK